MSTSHPEWTPAEIKAREEHIRKFRERLARTILRYRDRNAKLVIVRKPKPKQ